MNECSIDNECHVNAQCANTDGSYTCGCRDGYAGDGKNCTGKRLRAVCFKTIYLNFCLVPFTVVIFIIKIFSLTINARLRKKSNIN